MITREELIDFYEWTLQSNMFISKNYIESVVDAYMKVKSIKSSAKKPKDCIIHTIDLNGKCFKCDKQIFEKDDKGNLHKL